MLVNKPDGSVQGLYTVGYSGYSWADSSRAFIDDYSNVLFAW